MQDSDSVSLIKLQLSGHTAETVRNIKKRSRTKVNYSRQKTSTLIMRVLNKLIKFRPGLFVLKEPVPCIGRVGH